MKQHYVMPVGEDDFKRVREEYYYVDKTDLIKNLIDGHAKVTLITRPRRFGKTLALSMLYYFFDIRHKDENKSLFTGCKIEEAGDGYMQMQGSKPVIFISLKDIKQTNFSDMLERMKYTMQSLYNECAYLLESGILAENEATYFQQIRSLKVSSVDLQLSLKNLTEYLHRYHQKTVLVLIDEYDAPIQYAWDNGYYDDAITFMRDYLSSVLKTNPHLDFAVLTGVLRIAKESIFSSLNNLKVSSLITGSYAEAMGFTKDEVQKMAADFHAEDKLPELKAWYDGYSFAGTEVYNPWSVINYFDHQGNPALYWVNTSGNSILAELLKGVDKKQEQELQSLLQGGTVNARLDESVIYADISRNRNALYTMLLTTGYLTTASSPILRGGTLSAKLRIPNQEVRAVYTKEILERIETMEGTPNLLNLMDDLLCGNAEGFSTGLSDYLETLASHYDTANKESFYHGFLLGLLALLMPDYRVLSNRESGYGRFDLAIFPNQGQTGGVIMEFKVADKEEDLPAKAAEALAQIENKDYLAEFRHQNITSIWQYGIAFCGKKCHIEAKI